MKIRTQLILAFILLAVVPLTAIVSYSYFASMEALEAAHRKEATLVAQEMDGRLASIRQTLGERLGRAGSLPISAYSTQQTASAGEQPIVGKILDEIGDAATFVDTLEIVPELPQEQLAELDEPDFELSPEIEAAIEAEADRHPVTAPEPAPAAVAGGTKVLVPVAPGSATHPASAASGYRYKVIQGAAPPAAAPPAPPAPPTPITPVVIDIDAIVREVHAAGATLTPQEVEKLKGDIAAAAAMAPKLAEAQQKIESMRVEMRASDWEKWAQRQQEIAARIEEREKKRQEILREREAARHATALRSHEAATVRAGASAQGLPATRTVPATPVMTAEPKKKPAAPAAAPKAKAKPVKPKGPAAKPVEQQAKKQPPPKPAGLFGQKLEAPIMNNGVVVGHFKAELRPEEILKRVFDTSGRQSGEIPFAVDKAGKLYTRNDQERAAISTLPLQEIAKSGARDRRIGDEWVVAVSRDADSGVSFGVARRIGQPLQQLRSTAAKNFSYGIALIGLALIGVVPLANHITRDVKLVTEGAQRIAAGHLETSLPVRSSNEIGQLAAAFNQMAHDLGEHQKRLIEEERHRKEQELERRLLEAEYARKTTELEDARRFQLSLLPKSVPQLPSYEIAVYMRTATEVGGDYYDFHVADDGTLTAVVGDAVGHGARAGTMVTVIKSLFAGYSHAEAPSRFLTDATQTIRRMELGRMSMGLAVLRVAGDVATIAAAAMPPVLVRRAATGDIEEISIQSTPLGTLTENYEDHQFALKQGDTILMMSDGFPELANDEGHQLGYDSAMATFREVADEAPADVVAHLASVVDSWRAGQSPNDDVTFVVIRRT